MAMDCRCRTNLNIRKWSLSQALLYSLRLLTSNTDTRIYPQLRQTMMRRHV
jgi:hypothetical protein